MVNGLPRRFQLCRLGQLGTGFATDETQSQAATVVCRWQVEFVLQQEFLAVKRGWVTAKWSNEWVVNWRKHHCIVKSQERPCWDWSGPMCFLRHCAWHTWLGAATWKKSWVNRIFNWHDEGAACQLIQVVCYFQKYVFIYINIMVQICMHLYTCLGTGFLRLWLLHAKPV